MTKPLDATEGQIKTHWRLLDDELNSLSKMGFPPSRLGGYFAADRALATLESNFQEEAERQRGGRVKVVPLDTTSSRFWLSYLEEWSAIQGGKHRFRSANLTFFQSTPGDQRKVQLFRAEWPGYTDWGDGSLGWQAVGAGHPHWQFDALNAYVSAEEREAEVQRILDVLSKPDDLEEFTADDIETARDLVGSYSVDLIPSPCD